MLHRWRFLTDDLYETWLSLFNCPYDLSNYNILYIICINLDVHIIDVLSICPFICGML